MVEQAKGGDRPTNPLDSFLRDVHVALIVHQDTRRPLAGPQTLGVLQRNLAVRSRAARANVPLMAKVFQQLLVFIGVKAAQVVVQVRGQPPEIAIPGGFELPALEESPKSLSTSVGRK